MILPITFQPISNASKMPTMMIMMIMRLVVLGLRSSLREFMRIPRSRFGWDSAENGAMM